jgi:hypothetical protein
VRLISRSMSYRRYFKMAKMMHTGRPCHGAHAMPGSFRERYRSA